MANDGKAIKGRPPVHFSARLRLKADTGCLEWTGTTVRGGYGQVRRGRKMVYAHRVAFEMANGEIPIGLFVCHKCDNPSCCNPDHMFLGTHIENMQDKIRKGRAADFTGIKNPAVKLTESAVVNIRRLCALGKRQADVANLYGVTQAMVSLIVRRAKWSHIK